MKKRLAAFILAALMIVMSLPLMASAETYTELSTVIEAARKQSTTTSVYIIINSTVYVTRDTAVPADVTIQMYSGGKIIVTANLVVYGCINGGTSSNIIVSGNGNVSYSTQYYWTSYDPAYPYTYYPVGGPYCSKCGTNSVHWCSLCSSYHCANCGNHYNQTTTHYCNVHKCEMTYCSMCGKYYCQACVGGVHGRTSSDSQCIIVPFTSSSVCPTHGIKLYYCQYCKKYYCPECCGGIHVQAADGSCYIYSGTYVTNCPVHGNTKIYCQYCNKYYCPICEGGYHVENPAKPGTCITSAASSLYYCTIHGCAKTYCAHCNAYYCPYCVGGYHVYDSSSNACYIYPNGSASDTTGTNQYYYYEYTYVPGYGYIVSGIYCIAPTASVKTGATVTKGTSVVLSCPTPGSVIHYTTDGSEPTVNSKVYTGPITINSNMTVRAIACHNQIKSSKVASFTYLVKNSVTPVYSDISKYPGLSDSLSVLLTAGVMTSSGKFNPAGTVSWTELKDYFNACGIKVTSSSITSASFADPDEITYEEFVYASYKILRANKLISTPKKGSSTLSQLTYKSEITNKAIYKAAYCSLIENGVLYATTFHPQESANRAYLATMLAWAYKKAN